MAQSFSRRFRTAAAAKLVLASSWEFPHVCDRVHWRFWTVPLRENNVTTPFGETASAHCRKRNWSSRNLKSFRELPFGMWKLSYRSSKITSRSGGHPQVAPLAGGPPQVAPLADRSTKMSVFHPICISPR